MKYIASVNSQSCRDHKSKSAPSGTSLQLAWFWITSRYRHGALLTRHSVSPSFLHYFPKVSQIPTLKPSQIQGSATPGRIPDTPLQQEKSNDTNHNSEALPSRQALSAEQPLSSTLQIIWCLFTGSNTTLRENYNRNYTVPIQYSEGRQAFSSQTTILRNIISPVQLLKGKNPEFSWFALPVCSSFQAVANQDPVPALCQSELTVCPNPNPRTEAASQESLHQTHMFCTSNIASKVTN